jgi:hypothetical protein
MPDRICELINPGLHFDPPQMNDISNKNTNDYVSMHLPVPFSTPSLSIRISPCLEFMNQESYFRALNMWGQGERYASCIGYQEARSLCW